MQILPPQHLKRVKAVYKYEFGGSTATVSALALAPELELAPALALALVLAPVLALVQVLVRVLPSSHYYLGSLIVGWRLQNGPKRLLRPPIGRTFYGEQDWTSPRSPRAL